MNPELNQFGIHEFECYFNRKQKQRWETELGFRGFPG